MPASRETQDYIEKELPYKILMNLYSDSRASLRELGKDLGISYHVIQSVLNRLEKEYNLTYTLQLDEDKLGFAEGRIIAIKFGIMPGVDFLKDKLRKDIFVQDGFLSSGDFDLLLYVVGLTGKEFQSWQFNFRIALGEYKPTFKFSAVDESIVGFLPLRNEIIEQSSVLSETEKRVLKLLNENSRMKLKDIVKESKTTQTRVLYVMDKLKERGIIKRFSTLVQNPDKRLFLSYGTSLVPVKNHKDLDLEFVLERIEEDLHEITNDYCLILNTNGVYDAFFMCTFKNGEEMSKRGAELLQGVLAVENPHIEKALVTDVIVGKWPFHLEDYSHDKKYVKSIT